ncbi:MAG: MazG family protein [Ruminococcaceae bacterium]|nr:MazG family protein [Oscillospiraceae bacterium]
MNKKELTNKEAYTFEDLVAIMKLLRAPDGCPWDREQDHKSIRKNFIEETYEVCEAIDTDDSELLCEELGDVLLQVVFHAEMSSEAGEFDVGDVITGVCKKLVHRHPHIFAEVSADTSEEVLKNWEAIKKEEKGRNSISEVLAGVCTSLPALMKMQKLIKKSRQNGYMGEFAAPSGLSENEVKVARELFRVCKMADELSVDAEEVLDKAAGEYTKNAGKSE